MKSQHLTAKQGIRGLPGTSKSETQELLCMQVNRPWLQRLLVRNFFSTSRPRIKIATIKDLGADLKQQIQEQCLYTWVSHLTQRKHHHILQKFSNTHS